MNTGTLIAISGLVFTLVAAIATSVGFLVRTTWQLSKIVNRVEKLEEKAIARDEKSDETDRAVSKFQLLADGYDSIKRRQEKTDSYVTELRIKTGILDARTSQGEVG